MDHWNRSLCSRSAWVFQEDWDKCLSTSLRPNQTDVPIAQADASYQAYTAHYHDYLSSLSSQTFYKLVNGGHGIAVEYPESVLEAIETVLNNIP
jgi:hypothetical protein